MLVSRVDYRRALQQRHLLSQLQQSCLIPLGLNQGKEQTHLMMKRPRTANHHEDHHYHGINFVKSNNLLLPFSGLCLLTKSLPSPHPQTACLLQAVFSSKPGCTRWRKKLLAKSKRRRTAAQHVRRNIAPSRPAPWVAACGPVKTRSRLHLHMLLDHIASARRDFFTIADYDSHEKNSFTQ